MELQNAVITEVVNAFTVHSIKGQYSVMKNREHYGLSFCTGGQITYRQNEREYVEDKLHAVLLPKGKDYTITKDEAGSFPVINFETLHPLCDTVSVIEVQNVVPLLKSFEDIKRLIASGNNRAKVLSLFYDMLNELSWQKNAGALAPAIKAMYDNYHDPSLNVAFFARKCNISEVYFRKLFREYFHIPPKQFILNLRIDKAKSLLSEGKQKIWEIAEACGFESNAHFCRIFKAQTGFTPAGYRQSHQLQTI